MRGPGRLLRSQTPAWTPVRPPRIAGAGPQGHQSFQVFGISLRSFPSESIWLQADSACSSGTAVMGGSRKSVSAPMAENANPVSPLISPAMKRISASSK